MHNLYWHTHDVLDHLVNRNFCTIATPAPCSTYAHCPNGDDGDARRVYSPADLSPKCPGPTTLQTGFLLLPGGLGLCAPAVGSLLDGAYSPRGGQARGRDALVDLALELAQKSAGFRHNLPPESLYS